MCFTRQILIAAFCTALYVPVMPAQFTSGSTGADGAYSPTVSGDFDPIALGIDKSGDNVFNFTTINIPVGVTIKLRASKLRNAAVTWLATGNVTIAGTLDLSGAPGASLNTSNPSALASTRVLPEPGPGGYTGGLGSIGGVVPQAGAGPGGGPAGVNSATFAQCLGGDASFISGGYTGFGQAAGTPYGSYLLVPLYGGSGGGGGGNSAVTNDIGGIGGAGGGAIRIASTTQISVTGTINASGGSNGNAPTGTLAGCPSGSGSGGAIHLVAPAISGNGVLIAISGGGNYSSQTPTGIIRLSVNSATNTSGFSANPAVIQSALYLPPANSTLPLPSLTITKVNGVAVPAQASGQYLTPDVTIAATGAVTVNLAAANIPLGTVPTLRITASSGGDTTLSCTALAGLAVSASTSTCSATFPFAVSIAGVRASW
jgi:hypothetical protein